MVVVAHAYMLECADGTFYVGSTRCLEDRLRQHRLGDGAAYTKRRLPVTLVWAQEFERVDETYAMEQRIQGWSRAKRKALIDHRYGDLPALSRSSKRRA